jgi:hypothetical protein
MDHSLLDLLLKDPELKGLQNAYDKVLKDGGNQFLDLIYQEPILSSAGNWNPPPFSTTILIGFALIHSQGGVLSTQQICIYLEEFFPYFRQSNCWKPRVRGRLSHGKFFKKFPNEGKRYPLWGFNKDHVAEYRKLWRSSTICRWSLLNHTLAGPTVLENLFAVELVCFNKSVC